MIERPSVWLVVDREGILYVSTFAKELAIKEAERWNAKDPKNPEYEVLEYVWKGDR